MTQHTKNRLAKYERELELTGTLSKTSAEELIEQVRDWHAILRPRWYRTRIVRTETALRVLIRRRALIDLALRDKEYYGY